MSEPYRPTGFEPVVILNPDNPHVHGRLGLVTKFEPWGCHLVTDATATGRYRAAWEEMGKPEPAVNGFAHVADSRQSGYSGDECPRCKGMRMRRNGACLICDDCGESSGCS